MLRVHQLSLLTQRVAIKPSLMNNQLFGAVSVGTILSRSKFHSSSGIFSDSLSPFGDLTSKLKQKEQPAFDALKDAKSDTETAEPVQLPNTRGEYREQICRTAFLHTSSKKLNLLAHLIKGLDVEDAMLHMMFLPKGHTEEILWALQEGCKIAKEVQNIDPKSLYVAWAMVGKGPISRRPDIRGRGRTGVIRSQQSHMVIMLREKAAKPDAVRNRICSFPRPDRRVINPRIAV